MLSWNEHIKKGLIRKTTGDKRFIKSLVSTADRRIKVISLISIDEETASTVFTNHYDSLREICEAIAILRGYKIYSHEAVGLFLKEVLKEDASTPNLTNFRI